MGFGAHKVVISSQRKFSNISKIFFSGIGGSGVSAIAGFMSESGIRVTGSDRSFDSNPSHNVYKTLLKSGINIVPQDGKAIDSSFDFAVFSTAVEQSNPEMICAKNIGLTLKTRPEFLSEIVSEFRTIAVAGTSGKSTTAGMIAFVLQYLGLGPNFIGGGRVKQFKTEINAGNFLSGASDTLVIEACESDGSIVNYRPEHTILLNLDFDHHSISDTSAMFESLCMNTSGIVAVNADDRNLQGFLKKDTITFSAKDPANFRATNIELYPLNTLFTLNGLQVRLKLPGIYNLYNAMACAAILCSLGIDMEDIAEAISEFVGIERRFDIWLNEGKKLVIDDYAHNPHKIVSLMDAVKKTRESVCFIFQPHGFGPTKMMKDEYINAFSSNLRDSDRLIVLPIYYAGGTARKDISSEDLALGVRARAKSAEALGRDEVLQEARKHDCYVVLGARDETLSDFAKELAARIK
ncbi:MAG: hypothetical protein EPN22_02445 [Nitrospirae bacterium]|nr:MAG: hypothetical protein EPN22_02445 [Nitrospirota bacterium]